MRFVICHVKNEEYLLNWWLKHHREKFDHGIIIDYNSTDSSMDMVRELTPNWQIVKSVNKDFNAANCDSEIISIERSIQEKYRYSWMITLNVTEFLVGNTKRLLSLYKSPKYVRLQKLLPCDVMVDTDEQKFTEPDPTQPLVKQRTFGIPCDYSENTIYNPYTGERDYIAEKEKVMYDNRKMRSMHNFSLNYFETSVWGVGRHYWGTPAEDFRILWYGYSPFTDSLINRKLAIQQEIPKADKEIGNGGQHILDRDLAINRYNFHKRFAVNLNETIQTLENKPTS